MEVRQNRTLLIAIVIVLVLACCCIAFAATGWFIWGDSLAEFLGLTP